MAAGMTVPSVYSEPFIISKKCYKTTLCMILFFKMLLESCSTYPAPMHQARPLLTVKDHYGMAIPVVQTVGILIWQQMECPGKLVTQDSPNDWVRGP